MKTVLGRLDSAVLSYLLTINVYIISQTQTKKKVAALEKLQSG